MRLRIKGWWEARLLLLAAWILDRNVARSPVISRRDNNALFEMEHALRSIARRVSNGYAE